MKILAVSDKESATLLNWIEQGREDLKAIDLIVSCGDLPSSYLEYISGALDKDVIYVRGNHDQEVSLGVEITHDAAPFLQGPSYKDQFDGLRNLHGKLFYYHDWVFVGFEGSLWYNGEGPQYHEDQMHRVVKNIENRLRFRKLSDWFRGSMHKIVVISHAPLSGVHDAQDLCHRGFQCFHHFLNTFSPVFWIHGHTATENLTQNQMSRCGKTTVLNAFEYKFINIQPGHDPLVSFNPSVLREAVLL
jgi:Icc-related predicted phosphoesterase